MSSFLLSEPTAGNDTDAGLFKKLIAVHGIRLHAFSLTQCNCIKYTRILVLSYRSMVAPNTRGFCQKATNKSTQLFTCPSPDKSRSTIVYRVSKVFEKNTIPCSFYCIVSTCVGR